MYITNTVSTHSVTNSEIFTFSIDATYRNENSSLIEPKITTYFPSNISYYLPDINDDLIDIQIDEDDDGDYLTFIFNPVRSGFNYNLLIGASFSDGRSLYDTFTSTATLFIDDVEIESAVSSSVIFNVTTNLTINLSHNANANLKAGDTINAFLYVKQEYHYGIAESNLVLTSNLSGNFTLNPKYTPTGYDISPTHIDNHLDGHTGVIDNDNKSLTFSMDYFGGEKYVIQFQLIVNDDASADDELYLSTDFVVNGIPKYSLDDYFYVRSEPIDLELTVTSPTYTVYPANTTVKTLLSNTSEKEIESGEMIINIPVNVNVSQFKFISSSTSISNYSIYYASNDKPEYTSLYTNMYGSTPNIITDDLILEDDYITGFKIIFDDLSSETFKNYFYFSYIPFDNNTSTYTTSANLNIDYDYNTYNFENSSTTSTYNKSVYKTELLNTDKTSFLEYDDELYLEVKIMPDEGATIDPVIIYELPDYFSYVSDSIYFSFYDDYLDETFYSYNDDFPINDNYYYSQQLMNYNESGKNIIRTTFQNLTITSAQSLSMFIKVKFSSNHKDVYVHTGYLGGSYEYVDNYGRFTDIYDYDGDSDTTDLIADTDPIYLINTYSSNVVLTNLVSSDNINYYNSISIANNNTFTYKLEIFNTAEESLSNITIIDILPHSKDTNILYENDFRESTSDVYLYGDIKIKVIDTINNTETDVNDYLVYYSDGYNPIRFNYLNEEIGEDEWYSEIGEIKSFKIELDPSFTLETYEKLVVYVPLINNYLSVNNDIATNTFAINASIISDNEVESTLLPLESTDTYVNTINSDVYNITGYTFIDNNKDGIYDSSDNKINDVEISLYDYDMNLLKMEKSYDNEIYGNGYFSFSDLGNDTYYISVTTPDDYNITKEVLDNEFGNKVSEGLKYNPVNMDSNITDYYIGFVAADACLPTITICNNIVVLDSNFDPMSIVSAIDYLGNDISSNVIVNYNDVNTFISGNYTVKYSVTDAYGNSCSEWFYIYVESEEEIDRNISINNFISSTALIDTSIASIINSESDKLTAIINNTSEITDLIAVNSSVDCMIKKITNLSIVNYNNIHIVKDCNCK